MNEGLFVKYGKVLKQKKSEKEDVINLLKQITGIDFITQEIKIEKKVISFQISSVKKSIIIKKNIQIKLKEKGYSIKI